MSAPFPIPEFGPLYGRKYQVILNLPGQQQIIADSDWDPSVLRVTFDIRMMALQEQFWECDVAIYNADGWLIDAVLGAQGQAATVQISAGYQNGNYAVIWDGPIFQAFLERENVVDLKLTIVSMIRLLGLIDGEDAGFNLEAAATQIDILNQIASKLHAPFAPAGLSSNVGSDPIPRGVTVFGNLSKVLSDLAEDNNMQWWLSSLGLNFGDPTEDFTDSSGVSVAPALIFSPPVVPSVGPSLPLPAGSTGSILGTPQQTMYGVAFRVCLDPRVKVEKPLMSVKIDNSALRILKLQIGQNPRLLDQDGVYVVVGLRHFGDTRGNDWYTEIDGWTRVGNTLAELTLGVADGAIGQGQGHQ